MERLWFRRDWLKTLSAAIVDEFSITLLTANRFLTLERVLLNSHKTKAYIIIFIL